MTQQEALDILKTGESVFLTGAAGSGKTHVLRQYIDYLKENRIPAGITASTGIAATHIGGITIHSWAGIGIHDELGDREMHALLANRTARRRIERAKALIIDEISMLHHFRLDLVDKALRLVRGSQDPFGGLQVVVCGDFFQLPPVSPEYGQESLFAYHAQSWQDAGFKVCYLEEQHRQSDGVYLQVLQAIRSNAVDDNVRQLLQTRFHKPIEGFEKPTRLFTHNANVDAQNGRELDELPGYGHSYPMGEKGKKNYIEILKKNCLAPEVLSIKKGARVMFVKNNFELGYVNGSLGIVEECDEDAIRVRLASGRLIDVPQETWVIEEDGSLHGQVTQYPLRLAWAITVHKSQGMSLDAAQVDLSRSFEKGMGYVALSRVKTLHGLSLLGMNERALQVHDEALEYDELFREASERHAQEIRDMDEDEKLRRMRAFVWDAGDPAGEDLEEKDTVTQTKELLAEGKLPEEIARLRGLTEETILSHCERIREADREADFSWVSRIISPQRMKKIAEALKKAAKKDPKHELSHAKRALGDSYSYRDIRLGRLMANKEN
jgi:hypothetical protein